MICFKCNVLKEDAYISRTKIEMQKKGTCPPVAGNSQHSPTHLFKPNGRLLFFVFPVNCIWSFWFSNASYRMIRYSKESLTYQEANIHFNKPLGAWPIWLLENIVSWYNDCFLTASVGFNVITIKSKYSAKMWIELVPHQKLSKFQCLLACSTASDLNYRRKFTVM